jgi:serine/threonine protein kinase
MNKYQRFGKYLILDHLVDGGMAKICRARYLSEQANKIVAIKMVQPQFSKDPVFRQMFENELKLAFSLSHPNIAQTYDYGIVDEQLFTAMEYVEGANLKQYLDRLKKNNFIFPVDISTYIISQAAQALHYAHTFTDKLTGKPLNIVHRDISPHNIMLRYDGAVKLIDFGIAKANTNSEATQAGTIKGKLSYIAPEYLEGLELDARYDLFALGVTFWELLCNQKLFSAPNDLAILKKIQACQIPIPSSINPKVPKELDNIILKALSVKREDRYENLDLFNRALIKFLYSYYPDFNASDLSTFAKKLFQDDIKDDQNKMIRYGQIDVAPYLEDMQKDSSGIRNQSGSIAIKIAEERIKKTEVVFEAVKDTRSLDLESTRSHKTKVAHSSTRINSPYQTEKPLKTPEKRNDSHSVKPRSSEKNNLLSYFLMGCIALIFYIKKDIFLGKTSDTSKTSPTRTIATVDNKFSLFLEGYDPSMNVYLNNQKISYNGSRIKISLDDATKIRIEKAGKAPFEQKIQSPQGQSKDIVIAIPELQEAELGMISSSDNYGVGAKLIMSVAGEKVEQDLPVRRYRMPAGVYEGVIIDPVLGTEKNIQIKVEPNKNTNFD